MTSTDASARITPLTAKRESSPLDVKPPSTQRPVDQAGVATFDVAVDGRE
ncbi:MAG: hypothetical protein ACJ8FA_00890 [Xanthobacteraceae bacterium]|jgi:hypothetical protein